MGEFKTIQEVNEQFYRLFLDKAEPITGLLDDGMEAPFIPMTTHKNIPVSVLVRYAKRGGSSQMEDRIQYYPNITITNFEPKPDLARSLFTQESIAGGYDFINRTAMEIFFPAPLNFRYQCSIVSETESAYDAMLTWFYKNFDLWKNDKALLLNRVETEEDGPLGVVVPYSSEVFNVLRTDGMFESVIDFMLKTYVHFKVPITKSLMERFGITINQANLENGSISLTEGQFTTLQQFVIENPIKIIGV